MKDRYAAFLVLVLLGTVLVPALSAKPRRRPRRNLDANLVLTNQAVAGTNYTLISNITPATSRRKAGKQPEPLIIERADTADYFRVEGIDEEIIRLKGDIVLTYRQIRLRGENITVNLETGKVYAWGDIFVVDGDRTLMGDGFYYDLDREKGVLFHGVSEIDGILYYGEQIKTLDKDFYKIFKGEFTTCSNEVPHYYIEGRKLWIYPDRSFLILHMFYRVGGVRLFYLPLAFQTQKGTGVITYAGYTTERGVFIQNTYRFNAPSRKHLRSLPVTPEEKEQYTALRKALRQKATNASGRTNIPYIPYTNWRREPLFRTELRADYFQFDGYYAGASLNEGARLSRFMDNDFSMNVARSSRLQADGGYEYMTRWFGSARQDFYLHRSDKASTKLMFYYFNASDYLFISEYMRSRVVQGGLATDYFTYTTGQKDYYTFTRDDHYMQLTHRDANQDLFLENRWRMEWNNIYQRYTPSYIVSPGVRYNLRGTLVRFTVSTNPGFGGWAADLMFNDIKWRLAYQYEHIRYMNRITDEYTNTRIFQDIKLGLYKSFDLFTVLVYQADFLLGTRQKTGYDLTPLEEENNLRDSYNYYEWKDTGQLNFHSFFAESSINSYFRAQRSIVVQIPSDREESEESEYGNVKRHDLSLLYSFKAPGLLYTASTRADLMHRKDEELDLFDRARYDNLIQQMKLSLSKVVSLDDNFQYSIRDRTAVQNTFGMGLAVPAYFDIGAVRVKSLDGRFQMVNSFINLLDNYLTAGYNLGLQPFRFWKLNLSVFSENRHLYYYSKSALAKLGLDRDLYRNFFQDLVDSFNFFDRDKRERSYFKLDHISLYGERDLHCWQLVAGYTLSQQYTYVSYYPPPGYPYWSHSIWVQIHLKGYESVRYKRERMTDPPKAQAD